jgi:hypothetical protein
MKTIILQCDICGKDFKTFASSGMQRKRSSVECQNENISIKVKKDLLKFNKKEKTKWESKLGSRVSK